MLCIVYLLYYVNKHQEKNVQTLTLTLTLTLNKIYFDINERDKQQKINSMI